MGRDPRRDRRPAPRRAAAPWWSRSTRAGPTAAIRRGCGTCRSSSSPAAPVIATGERATDLAVRLDHAGVTYRKDTRVAAGRRPFRPRGSGRDRGDLHQLLGALAGARPWPLTRWSTSRSCSRSCSAPTATAGTRSCSPAASTRRGIAARVIEVGITDPIPRQADDLPARRRRGLAAVHGARRAARPRARSTTRSRPAPSCWRCAPGSS